MSCVLRILGTNLDVDKFVENTGIAGFKKGYKGHFIYGAKNKRLEYSYASIVVSQADFSDIKIQIQEAEDFLLENKAKLKNIAATPDIDFATIDFGADSFMENGMVKSFYFPPTLVAVCAELKMAIELSVYSV